MSIRKPVLTLIAAAALATAALPASQASAAGPVYVAPVGGGTTGAPWPVWALGAGVLSIMVRAAYVYRTECRELTGAEAFGGMVGPWPVYHQPNNKCAATARAPIVGRY
jgi:hypothetical protein